MHDLDLSSVGKTNQLYLDAQEILIRQSMSQKEDAFARNERDIARLVEANRTLEADLVRYKIALSPHKRLSNEVLSRIFDIIAEEYGPVDFPIQKDCDPPQLVLSRVCSRWRMLALHTSMHVNCHFQNAEQLERLCGWFEARNSLVVSLRPSYNCRSNASDIANMVQQVSSFFKTKIFHLNLTSDQFMELSKLPDSVLSHTKKLDLKLTSPIGESSTAAPSLRLRSLDLKAAYVDKDFGMSPLIPSMPEIPWNQLRSLSITDFRVESLDPIIDILRQTPLLQELRLWLDLRNLRGPLKQVTMPGLQTIYVEFQKIDSNLKILRAFICPALMEFGLNSTTVDPKSASEAYGIIKQQYNIEGLRTLKLRGYFHILLPLSSVLKDGPMLRELVLRTGTIIDDEAITGISNGSLGRHLRSLHAHTLCFCLDTPCCCIEKALEMVETRKRIADELIEKGCSWREAISTLKYVTIGGKAVIGASGG